MSQLDGDSSSVVAARVAALMEACGNPQTPDEKFRRVNALERVTTEIAQRHGHCGCIACNAALGDGDAFLACAREIDWESVDA